MSIKKLFGAKGRNASTDDDAAKAQVEPICRKCKKPIPAGAAFCPACGTPAPDPEREAAVKPGKAAKKDAVRVLGKEADIAKSTNDLAGFKLLFSDGVAETEDGVFSKTLSFGDISYEHEREDVKEDIFEKWCAVHAAFPPGTCYQLNLLNVPVKRRDVERYLPEAGACADIARAYNDIIAERQRLGRTDFERSNYISFAVTAEDNASAARKLDTLSEAVRVAFSRLDVKCDDLDGLERARLIKTMLCGPDEPFFLDYERLKSTRKEHVRDYVVPAWSAYSAKEKLRRRKLDLPGRVVKSFLIKDFGNDLSDRALRSIRALPIPMNISLLFQPQPNGETVKRILHNIDVVQAEIIDYSRSIAKSGGDPTLTPPALENREASQREQLDFIQEHDQTVSWFQGVITVWADDDDQLDVYTEMIMGERGNWTIDIVELPMNQEPALTGALPLATPLLLDRFRSLSTAEGAALIPFVSQSIHDDPKRSYMIGVDRVSGEAILVNPDNQKSPHAWLFGVTGGGKSMQMNSMLSYSLLQYPMTDFDAVSGKYRCDDPHAPQWHIFDFHAEYVDLVDRYGGVNSYFGPGHDSCLNPMDMTDSMGDLSQKAIAENADFFLALTESIMDRKLSLEEKNVIDSCNRAVYAPFVGKSGRPTLKDLHQALLKESTRTRKNGEKAATADIAQHMAGSFELFVEGSMNSFAGQTNVEEHPLLNNYVMSELGSTMQTLAMMSAIQRVRKCAFANYRIGKPTYVVIEECQILFDNDAAVRVLEALFAEMRKYGLHVICVTQLPNRVLAHPRAVNLFENSSTFILLPQQAENAETMSEMFRLSATQADALSMSADAGTGLVIVDGVKIPFRNRIPKNNLCYEIWNTDPDRFKKKKPTQKNAPVAPVSTRDEVAADEQAIEKLGISDRLANRLKGAGVYTIADLEGHSEKDLLRIDGVGPKGIVELKTKLEEHGLIHLIENEG